MTVNQDLKDRLDEFCANFGIPKQHHGSLSLLSGMAFVLGLEIDVRVSPHEAPAVSEEKQP
jgi:hypothetical protein